MLRKKVKIVVQILKPKGGLKTKTIGKGYTRFLIRLLSEPGHPEYEFLGTTTVKKSLIILVKKIPKKIKE
jgi:hypothetical protein